MQSPTRGKPRSARASIREGRSSYEAEESIRSNDRKVDRISYRRDSRCFQPNQDPTDLLDPHTRVHLEWSNVSTDIPATTRTFKKKRGSVRLLEGLSGRVGPGEIFGIIGHVGSGKSTLLKVLSGKFAGSVYGSIRVNGIDRDHRWKLCIAYIETNTDRLHSNQTVLESIQFVAEMCIPKKYGEVEKQARIDHVLKLMALEPIKEDIIGELDSTKVGISGGERRRLLIAHELLREPKLLFLDEPTSGLDASSAKVLMSVLHQLAVIESITIVLTAQQPRMSVLTKFDHILALQDGSPIFCGEIDDAVEYFEELGYVYDGTSENLAEFILDAVAGKRVQSRIKNLTPEELKENWRANWQSWIMPISDATVITENIKHGWTKKPCYNRSWWTEYKMIWRRQHMTTMRESNYLLVAFIASLVFGLYSGFVWFQMSTTQFDGVQDRLGLLYLIPRTAVLFIAAPVCFFNIPRVQGERQSSLYRCSAAYLGLLSFLVPIGFVLSLFQYVTVYYISGLRYTPFTAFLTYIGFQYLNIIVFFPMGFLVASLCSTYEAAVSVLVVLVLIFRLFGGLSLNLREMTPILSWLRFLSPAYYVYNGTAGNEFIGLTIAGESGEYWLNLYGLDSLSVIWCAGALMMYGAAMLVLAYFAWERATRPFFNLKTILED